MVLSIRMPEMPTTNLYMKYGMRKTKRQKAQTTIRQDDKHADEVGDVEDKKTKSSNYKKTKKTNMQVK